MANSDCDYLSALRPGSVLDFHLSGQCRDRKLDGHSRRVGEFAYSMGIFARTRRCAPGDGHERSHCRGAGASAFTSQIEPIELRIHGSVATTPRSKRKSPIGTADRAWKTHRSDVAGYRYIFDAPASRLELTLPMATVAADPKAESDAWSIEADAGTVVAGAVGVARTIVVVAVVVRTAPEAAIMWTEAMMPDAWPAMHLVGHSGISDGALHGLRARKADGAGGLSEESR